MKRIKILLVAALMGGCSSYLQAQGKKFPCKKNFQNFEKGLAFDSVSNIYMADTAGIQRLIRRSASSDLMVIVCSSTGCSGTQ